LALPVRPNSAGRRDCHEATPNQAKAKRATEEMLRQVKFDIAKLTAAFNGR
jgi:hypothetical protein